MKTVLVTSIGSMSSRIVIENLKKNGCRVIGTNIYPKEYIAESNLVDQFYNVPFSHDPNAYMKMIYSIIDTESINYIFPLTDPEVDVLSLKNNELKSRGACLCISNPETIQICRDKMLLNRYVSQKLPSVKTIPILTAESVNESTQYPVVCKLRNGRSSENLHIIEDYDEWNYIKAKIDLTDYLIQPYIHGDVVCADVVRHSSTNMTVVMPRRELLRTKNGAGLSVYVFNDEVLTTTCVRLAEILDINGCVNFEFIVEKDASEYYFLECNPRFSGGVAFSCINGYDYVTNHLKCFDGSDFIECINPYKNRYIVKMYSETITKTEGNI